MFNNLIYSPPTHVLHCLNAKIYICTLVLNKNNDVLPLHDENIEDDIDQVEEITEDQLEGPVAVAPVVI